MDIEGNTMEQTEEEEDGVQRKMQEPSVHPLPPGRNIKIIKFFVVIPSWEDDNKKLHNFYISTWGQWPENRIFFVVFWASLRATQGLEKTLDFGRTVLLFRSNFFKKCSFEKSLQKMVKKTTPLIFVKVKILYVFIVVGQI